MNTPQNPSEWAVQMGKNVISIIPTIRTFSYIFLPIRNSRFSSDSGFFVLFRTFSCTNGRQSLSAAWLEARPRGWQSGFSPWNCGCVVAAGPPLRGSYICMVYIVVEHFMVLKFLLGGLGPQIATAVHFVGHHFLPCCVPLFHR